MSATVQTGGSNGPLAGGGPFTPAAVQASAYAANPGDFVPVDTSSGAVTVTLPTAPVDGTTVAVKMVKQASTNAVTISAGGADTFNTVGGSASATLSLLNQALILQYRASIAVWYVLDDSLPLSQLDARYGKLSGATFTGIINANAGTDSAGSAPVLAPTFANGTAAQLSDLTRDYEVYLQVGTAGTAFTLQIGPTSGVANTIIASATPTATELLRVRLPAGWFLKWAGTSTTMANQIAIGC